MKIFEKLIEKIVSQKPKTKKELSHLITKLASQFSIAQPPTRELITAYQTFVKKKSLPRDEALEKLFCKASVRSASGIAVVTSLVKPYSCPGQCV